MALHTALRDGENYNINDKDLYNEKIFSGTIYLLYVTSLQCLNMIYKIYDSIPNLSIAFKNISNNFSVG